MQAIQLPEYNHNVLRAMLSLRQVDLQNPEPDAGEVIVRMHATTCNPSDIAFIRGGYNIVKPLPAIPGFEASGTVATAGAGCEDLRGKMVSCFVQSHNSGTWAEYFRVRREDLIEVDPQLDPDQAAAFSVNPFTAWGLITIARERGSRAILQNASGGQVAEFIRKLAGMNDIRVIDIVRKPATAEQLKKENPYTLCETDEDCNDRLRAMAEELQATTAFDAVGGPLAGMMFNAMPRNGKMVVYGGLSGKRLTDLQEMDIIFRNKSVAGFNLIDWKEELEPGAYERITRELEMHFIKGSLATRFQGTTTLENLKEGLKSYLKEMSAGKLLIKP